jgi:hypothetical protein
MAANQTPPDYFLQFIDQSRGSHCLASLQANG